jgi:hypothetical protein
MGLGGAKRKLTPKMNKLKNHNRYSEITKASFASNLFT